MGKELHDIRDQIALSIRLDKIVPHHRCRCNCHQLLKQKTRLDSILLRLMKCDESPMNQMLTSNYAYKKICHRSSIKLHWTWYVIHQRVKWHKLVNMCVAQCQQQMSCVGPCGAIHIFKWKMLQTMSVIAKTNTYFIKDPNIYLTSLRR